MAKPTPAQNEVVTRLIAGEAFPFTDGSISWVVQTHETSVEKGTREVLFHRAVRLADADPSNRSSYRYELFRIDMTGKVRKL